MNASRAELDAVVVGAGVVGLAIARQLAQGGLSVAVLEQESQPGQHTSSRNSEVIHAGFYYPPDSLKASLCVRGKAMLYDYCQARGIAYRQCGKLVLGQDEQDYSFLNRLQAQGKANGVGDLEIWNTGQLAKEEPQIRAQGALFSPSTGIVDAAGLLLALETDLLTAGGLMVCHSQVTGVQYRQGCFEVNYRDGDGEHQLHCEQLVNSGGLEASALAHQLPGADRVAVPATRWARGNYFSLSGAAPASRLIYPLPDEHGLGIHLTLDLQGQARFGPDVEWTDTIDYRANPGQLNTFVDAIRQYWPALEHSQLTPAWAGIRPKAWLGDSALNDFVLLGPESFGVSGLVQLFGIESPGLTACLAIAERVALMLTQPATDHPVPLH